MKEEWSIDSSQLTHIGRRRDRNEDHVGSFEPQDPKALENYGRLFVVADGVGGGTNGHEASRYAVQSILHDCYNDCGQSPAERLVAAVREANTGIFHHNMQSTNGDRMATTVVAALVHGRKLIVTSVGDSRAYLVRQNKMDRITRDHSLVARMVEEGILTPEQARRHPRRNIIIRSLGIDHTVEVDCFTRTLAPGDVVVLCSDGLTSHVTDDEIAQAVEGQSADGSAQKLIDLANARGGSDNISVSIIRIL